MTRMLAITVGVDAEEPSRRAVEWAIRQATTRSTRITLVTAFDMILVSPVDEEARLEAERARILAAAPGTVVDTVVVEGSIPTILDRYAAHSDLLVIGAHRTRHLASVLLGDLPARVARRSSCPVVVVPDDWTPRGGDRDGAVVVGMDDDASSDAALRWAAEFADDGDLDVNILHAWSRPHPASDPVTFYVFVPEDLRDEHRRRVTRAARRLRQRFPKLGVREDLYEGKPSNGLVALADSAELVVVGSHRRGAVAGFVLGSVGRELLHYSRTPVCIVPSTRAVSRSTREPAAASA